MNAGQVKQIAKEWVGSNREGWTGLRAAHLVGSIAGAPDDVPYPPYKDVDLHLIFDEGSPQLVPTGPFAHLIETEYKSVLLEAGLKSVQEYGSTEAVLSNPEIAHHLLTDCILYDPDRLLRALSETVRLEYPRRKWVLARCAYEKMGLEQVFGYLLGMARATFGATREMQIVGYGITFACSHLCVATLQAPTTGSRASRRLSNILDQHGHSDLYDEFLDVMGVRAISKERAEELLEEGAEAFDIAVQVKRTPHPFGHKIHKHLRPYFVGSCRSLMDEGYHREATLWLTPFYLASTDIIKTDGTPDQATQLAQRLDQFLIGLGIGSPEEIAAKVERAKMVYSRIGTVADEIVTTNPNIID